MAHAETLEHGRAIRVGPDRLTVCDVLKYMEALIEEEGWNNTAQGYVQSSPQQGWTLHDAIGEANRRLFRPNARPGDGKEGVAIDDSETTRTGTQQAINDKLPATFTDQAFNDQAGRVDIVLDVIRAAIKEECGE